MITMILMYVVWNTLGSVVTTTMYSMPKYALTYTWNKIRGFFTVTLSYDNIYIVTYGEVTVLDPRKRYTLIAGKVSEDLLDDSTWEFL